MDRSEMLRAVRERDNPWDMIIIGGGATGLGAAVDAASRGYDTVLFEASDFAKGTSSRSTKLVHGGVRYLQQGNVTLVMEALRERGLMRTNAPHLVRDLAFIVPSYEWWESPFYGIGLKVYDMLAGRYGFGASAHLSHDEVIAAIPSIQPDGLRGGTLYYDGQFDDARFAISLAQTAVNQGGVAINYTRVTGFRKRGGVVEGVIVRDEETGEAIEVDGRVVINATGPFSDEVRRLDHADSDSIIAPSQGVHIVLDRSFLAGESAIMVPHTDDGRVMFAIPWYDVTVVGTTDTAIEDVSLEPKPRLEEIEFILETANRYLARPATHDDIRSVFAGIRPLVRAREAGDNTAALSREHTIIIDPESGLMTIAGGKWTTYRKMAEDVIDHAIDLGGLEPRPCVTKQLPLHGYHRNADRFGRLEHYGSDAPLIQRLMRSENEMDATLHPRLRLTKTDVIWACQNEMARTVDDVLARRSRSLLFDARASIDAAPAVAEIMREESGHDPAWMDDQIDTFGRIASGYLYRD